MPREIVEIPLSELTVSALNVRRHGGRDVAGLARAIASKGLIYPLLVRKTARRSYEVIAGKRRLLALQRLDKTGDVEGSVAPCIVLADTDDASAIELSLMENTHRLDMDVLDQCAAFQALIREGRDEREIAHTFAVPVATVKKRLALAGLVPEAHARYRAGEIDDKVLAILTLGSKERQRAYLRLLNDPDQTPPPAWQLKQWLMGGAAIEAKHALFDLKAYTQPITSDLFNETSYCTDADAFWHLQRAAVDNIVADLKAKGWQAVTIIEPDQPFQAYQWEPATKAEGGHVVIVLRGDGSVQIEKGLIGRAEARARNKANRTVDGSRPETPARPSASDVDSASPRRDDDASGGMRVDAEGNLPEMTAALRNYVDLVRHSAVCASLLKKPKVALRVLAASLIAGSRHIQIRRDPRTPQTPEIGRSIAAMSSEAAQDSARHAVLASLGLDTAQGLFATMGDTTAILAKLDGMSDAQVIAILAIVATESLAVGSPLIDMLGQTLAVDVTEHWTPDATLLGLANRRPVIAAIASEVLGADAPRAHAMPLTGARAVIADSLKKSKVKWQPKWTQFPAGRYIERRAEST